MNEKRKILILLCTFVFAVVLCGAASAATTHQSVTSNSVSASAQNQVYITIYSNTPVTAKGQKISINNSAKNLGSSTSNAFYAKYYLVPKKSMEARIYIGQKYFPSLLEGNYDREYVTFTLPTTMKDGSYYVAAVAGTHVTYSTFKTMVYPKKVDSGVSRVKTYGKFVWSTYLTRNNNIVSYSWFYNPNTKQKMQQLNAIGKYKVGFLYLFVTPKITGQSNYWTYFASNLSPLNYYLNYFKPDMIKNGPNH
jgi:hypothetical protein